MTMLMFQKIEEKGCVDRRDVVVDNIGEIPPVGRNGRILDKKHSLTALDYLY